MTFRPISRHALLLRTLLAVASAAAVGCSPNGPGPGEGEGEGEGEGGEGEGEGEGEGPCPAGNEGGLSICQIQNEAAPGHPSVGEEVTVRSVVVTSPVFDIGNAGTDKGVFVSDLPIKEYGGILVTFDTEQGFAVQVGQLVDVTGDYYEFTGGSIPTESRIGATTIQATGQTAAVEPLVVSDPAVLADDETGEPYEGVLVKVEAVSVTNAGLDFGVFEVTGGLLTDDEIHRYDAVDGEVFTSLTGVMSYSAFSTGGGFRLMPRSADDVVSQSRPTKTISDLRDPASDGYVEPCDTLTCAPIVIDSAVVVSDTFFITTSQNNGPLYGFFVADPEAVDAEGRLLPYSAIQVTISPQRSDVTTTGFDFAEDQDHNFTGRVPQPGDVVSFTGENATFFGMPQVRFTTDLVLKGTTADPEHQALAVLPARFDGTLPSTDPRHPARLKGGRPAIEAAEFGAALAAPAVPGDPDVAQWIGVPVEIVNVTVIDRCVGTAFNPDDGANSVDDSFLRDFGYFMITGEVEVGDLFDLFFSGFFPQAVAVTDRTCENAGTPTENAGTLKCEDSRETGDTIDRMQGFIDISFDVLRFNPTVIEPATLFAPDNQGNCQ